MSATLRLIRRTLFVLGLAALPLAAAHARSYADEPQLHEFIDEMVARHGFDHDQLVALFDRIKPRPDIIEAISHPAEAKPWYQYRPIFLTPSRVEDGVRFWNQHAETLARAEQRYGVPARIIVAIIGVETRYGKYKGKYRVLESLATLAFDYPPRSNFFRSELEQFLLLTREEGIDPLSIKGSYAGAMGGPQFISSSYRNYAVDFDGDGLRDLWQNYADMIGSVANYFGVHGWRRGEIIAVPAHTEGDGHEALKDAGLKPTQTVGEIRKHGVAPNASLPDDTLAALIRLEDRDGYEYWLGLQNFYVITRYNHSPLYAMAVYQLANRIAEERQRKMAANEDDANDE